MVCLSTGKEVIHTATRGFTGGRWLWGDPVPEETVEEAIDVSLRQQKIQAQKDYCDREEVPHFAPFDGYCYSCGADIYDAFTLDQAANQLITGCPHCGRTYCD